MALWPAGLPAAPTHTGYAVEPVEQTVSTDMEVGPARMYRRTRATLNRIPVAFEMSDAQYAVFRAWWTGEESTDLAGGSRWFTGLTLALGSGLDDTPECRMVGPYRAEMRGGALEWMVSFRIEVR